MTSLGRGIAGRLPISLLVVVCSLALMSVPAHAAFPGNNGRIAVSALGPTGFDIHTMNPDGTDRVNITQTPKTQEHNPIWSPDGSKISFVREYDTDGGDDFRAFVMNADGSGRTMIRMGSPKAATWTPDGTQLMIGLHVYNLDGSFAGRLFPDIEAGWAAYAFIDSPVIAFTEHDGNELWTMWADGTDRTKLTSGPVFDADWGPDGESIIYTRSVSGSTGVWRSEPLRWLDSHSLLQGGTPDIPVQGRVSWSPDGTLLVFGAGDHNADPRASDIAISVGDETPYRLATPGIGEFDPSWGTNTSSAVADDLPRDSDLGQPIPVTQQPQVSTPQPKVSTPQPRSSAPRVLPTPSVDNGPALTKAIASGEARSALKRTFWKAYTRAARKRISCKRQSATRYRCTYSFKYRKKRRAGAVTIHANGSATGDITAVVRRTSAWS